MARAATPTCAKETPLKRSILALLLAALMAPLCLAQRSLIISMNIQTTGSRTFSGARAITIDHTKAGASDSANFPVLISGVYSYLATVPNGGSVRSASGYDVEFFSDSSLTTMLSWEVEAYSATDGTVVYWVRVPTLSASADTVIYMAYGSSTITTDQSDKTGTWASNYKAVYHLSGGSTLLDSTSSAYTLTGGASASTGKVGGAASLNGSTQWLTTHSVPAGPAYPYTMQAWVKLASATLTTDEEFIASETSSAGDYSWFEYRTPSAPMLRMVTCSQSCSALYTSEFAIPVLDTNWHSIVAVFAAPTSYLLYFDGQAVPLMNLFGGGATMSAPTDITFGAQSPGGGGGYAMTIDEARASSGVPPAAQILAEYNNQSSPSTFYSVGPAF